MPFLNSQAVDCLQPDIVCSGGITGTKAIADLAALYRTPITLHNVSGLLLNAASRGKLQALDLRNLLVISQARRRR